VYDRLQQREQRLRLLESVEVNIRTMHSRSATQLTGCVVVMVPCRQNAFDRGGCVLVYGHFAL
jgi:hypothetical protein